MIKFFRNFVTLKKCNNETIISCKNIKPILYYDGISPPARSVLMLIKAINLDVEYKELNLFNGDHLTKEYKEICPVHTVPTLKHDDLILCDSQAILIYLCEKFDKQLKFYPKDENIRIKIIEKLFFNGTLLFRRDSDALSNIILDKAEGISKHLIKLQEIYNFMEIFLQKSKYMACDYVTIADISILATLSTVIILQPIDPEKCPRLNEWYNNMILSPYYEENVKGVNRLREIVKDIVRFKIY